MIHVGIFSLLVGAFLGAVVSIIIKITIPSISKGLVNISHRAKTKKS